VTRVEVAAAEMAATAESDDRRRKLTVIALAAVLLVAMAILAIGIGAYHVPPVDVVRALASRIGLGAGAAGVQETVVLDIRLTRIVLAVVVGAALANSGAVYQGVFRNPLVEPYVLGVSSGAAFGAGVSVMFDFPLSLQALAFVFGMVAVFTTYTLARVRGQVPTVTLVLAGVVIGSMFSALFAIFQYVGTDEQLRRLVFWILGGLHRATWADVRIVAPLIVIGLIVIWRYAWELNVLTLGNEEAAALGIPVERIRLTLIIAATAATALAVSVSGIIAWVGLMVPHAARLVLGPDHRYLLPMSALIGAAFVILCDTLARTITTGEVPIGIITSILGAPYLIYLLRTRLDYFSGGT
jgi:iron complex transport system permease protein